MAVLPHPVGLRDVRDAEGFAAAAVCRTRLVLSAFDRQELLADGLALLWELEGEWDGSGSFAAYAHRFLPLRITSAWHSWHRGESIEGKTPDGRKARRYCPRLESWENVTALPGFDESSVRELGAFTRPLAA